MRSGNSRRPIDHMAEIWIIRETGEEQSPAGRRLWTAKDAACERFEVSELGKILMLHLPHYVRAPLVGFEAVAGSKASSGPKGWWSFFSGRSSGNGSGKDQNSGNLSMHESHLFGDLDFSEYQELTDYITSFRNALTRNSPVLAALGAMDPSGFEKIHGLYPCGDGAVRSLVLAGGPAEQRRFIQENYGRMIEILVDPAGSYDSNIGFRLDRNLFADARPSASYSLEKRSLEGTRVSLQLYSGNRLLFRLDNPDILYRLFMLQHAVDLSGLHS